MDRRPRVPLPRISLLIQNCPLSCKPPLPTGHLTSQIPTYLRKGTYHKSKYRQRCKYTLSPLIVPSSQTPTTSIVGYSFFLSSSSSFAQLYLNTYKNPSTPQPCSLLTFIRSLSPHCRRLNPAPLLQSETSIPGSRPTSSKLPPKLPSKPVTALPDSRSRPPPQRTPVTHSH